MVFAHTDEVDTDAVSQHGLLDHLADHVWVGDGTATGIDGDVTEGVEAQFDCAGFERGEMRCCDLVHPRSFLSQGHTIGPK
ncbi:MAG TPA: hypothetical protein PLV68_18505 [Ilumatobacteraceae bacterium]|nr:hypothetical protein [Ilumatobacteraceae bacterium]